MATATTQTRTETRKITTYEDVEVTEVHVKMTFAEACALVEVLAETPYNDGTYETFTALRNITTAHAKAAA